MDNNKIAKIVGAAATAAATAIGEETRRALRRNGQKKSCKKNEIMRNNG